MLESLPPELLFYILKCLPLQSLSAIRQTSKQWNQRFVEHESYIYRNAAFHHGFISSSEMTLDQAIEQAKTAVKDVSTWVGFCEAHIVYSKQGSLTVHRQTAVPDREELARARYCVVQRTCRRPRRCAQNKD